MTMKRFLKTGAVTVITYTLRVSTDLGFSVQMWLTLSL